MAIDPAIRDHKTWLGYLQPDGLVVSAAALVDLQVILPRDTIALQEDFLCLVDEFDNDQDEKVPAITDFKDFVISFLEWPRDCLWGLDQDHPLPDNLFVPLPEFNETLSPSFAFADPRPKNPENPWLIIIQTLPLHTDLDTPITHDARGWSASPSRRFERLLRETKVPIGIITNRTHIRIIYAPKGENAGSLTFPVNAMMEVAGRPILAALKLLLSRYRLLAAPSEARLPSLLTKSREYQSTVSTILAEQVLDALYELLRGFQSADENTSGELLKEVLKDSPDDVYYGLLTVLMRIVFLLYSEDRGLMPGTSLYVQNYSIHGLFEKLRTDNERYPDTMDHRYGAWAQLLSLFRLVCTGCDHSALHMPARQGHLFDPDRFPFLEGRSMDKQHLPLISDGVVYRVLDKLLILEGERLSYRTLDVEQIGSVYETMMGFRLEITTGQTIALKPGKRQGAPVPINLEQLMMVKGGDRAKWISERTDYKLPARVVSELKTATSIDGMLSCLERRIARSATPQLLPVGSMILMPTDARRKSGSHYTPRILTSPIVAKALEPVLKQLGEHPLPEDILNLKVCDPAMGSGAFLVEACRQLAEQLIRAWAFHGYKPQIPPDEDEVLYAQRLIVQRCIYGVDRNPMAVDLAKLSLWLATLAREHPFTFLDHSLRCGDSLVGLSREQILAFHWQSSSQESFIEKVLLDRIEKATNYRLQIMSAGDEMTPEMKQQKLSLANEALDPIRVAGDLAIAAFFSGGSVKKREEKRNTLILTLEHWIKNVDKEAWGLILKALDDLYKGEKGFRPFHWQIEFPEVFTRDHPGFDAIAGNPPFAGKNTLINSNLESYLDWLKNLHEESHGNSDLVAHFFRRSFTLLREGGCFGLISTNTIGQGDTRTTGLRWICKHNGIIYTASKRYKWPGQAAVVVSIVNIIKGNLAGPFELDGKKVPVITAYLFHNGGNENPAVLDVNAGKSFQGSIVLGMGFTFDNTDTKGIANPLSLMHKLIVEDERNSERIFPYIGGEEVNDHPQHEHHRFVINFADFPLCRDNLGISWAGANEDQRSQWLRTGIVPLDYPQHVATDWPELLSIVEQRIKGQRASHSTAHWWHFERLRGELYSAIEHLSRTLVINCGATPHFSFCFLANNYIFANTLCIVALDKYRGFSILQSRIHEVWSRFFGSSMKDDLRYTPTDCFETFPFPISWEMNAALEEIGHDYYEFRATLMVQNNEGLTKTYNRFHDPDETSSDIMHLRKLHDSMDRTVLTAYGWEDLISQCQCEFLLDYEEEDDTESINRRRKPWRYRWPDYVRDEVLTRLLALNAERAEEERLSELTSPEIQPKRKRGKKKSKNKQYNDKWFEDI